MFGIDIFDASLFPAMFVALVAGVLSFLSPCVLPIVPPYLAYMSGISVSDMKSGRSPLLAALFFVMGLSTVFCCWDWPHLPLARSSLAMPRPFRPSPGWW
jgi:cytochrome c-type biogenesis protein